MLVLTESIATSSHCSADCTLDGTRRLLEQIQLAEGVRAIAIRLGKSPSYATSISDTFMISRQILIGIVALYRRIRRRLH